MIPKTSDRPVILWLLSGCFIVYLMVVVGCITRLTHSGLSITDWKVMEMLPPMSEESWMEHFEGYKKSPEFIHVNSSMGLEEFKSIFWWEWIHRFIGRVVLGGTFFAGFIWFLIRKKFTRQTLIQSVFLCALGGAQGLIGWWMVKSGLQKDPAVSHYRLAIHLMSAFMVFAFTFWFALHLIHQAKAQEPVQVSQHRKLRSWIIALTVVIVTQIIFGAFVAGKKAGLYCPTWPKMCDSWFPSEAILKSDSAITNFFEIPEGIQWVHRTFAFAVVAIVVIVWFLSNRLQLNRAVYKGITFIIYGTTIQFILGVFTLLYHVPLLMGVLHQTGAFFLFATCIFLLYHVYRKPVEQTAEENTTSSHENTAVVQ